MKRPRIKRRANYVFIPAAHIPMDEVLRVCPLPPQLREFLPVIRGPLGQAILSAIAACLTEGFTHDQLELVVKQVVEFYTQSYHRCNACHNWCDESTAGAVVVDGAFTITALCPNCAKLAASGRATPAMSRNMQDHVFGGGE